MNQKIELIKNTIIDYVEKENPGHGILITGEWGVGKTYFWKNTLEDIINAKLGEQFEHAYIEAKYVSLYGVENIEEAREIIARKILSSGDFDPTKLDWKEAGKTSLTFTIKKLVETTGMSTSSSTQGFKNIVSLKNAVICLDDVERSGMSPDKLLSLINYLLENENIKVIILANEENILEEHADYVSKKEKAIGKTINFSNEPKEIIQTILDTFQESPTFSNLLLDDLKRNQEFIDSFIKRIEIYNFRILKYTIEDLHSIYNKDENNVLEKLNEKYRDQIIKFGFQLSFAIRSGSILTQDLKYIDSTDDYRKLLSIEINEENKKSRIEEFNKFYIQDSITTTPYFEMIKYLLCEGLINQSIISENLMHLQEIQEKEYGIIEKFRFLNIENKDELNEVMSQLLIEIENKNIPGEYYIEFIKKMFVFIDTEIFQETKERVFEIFETSLENNNSNFTNIPLQAIRQEKNNLPPNEEDYIKILTNSIYDLVSKNEEKTLAEKAHEKWWAESKINIKQFSDFLLNYAEPLDKEKQLIQDWLHLVKNLNLNDLKMLNDCIIARIADHHSETKEIDYWNNVLKEADELLNRTDHDFLSAYYLGELKRTIKLAGITNT